MRRIFISYSNKDTAFVAQLERMFRQIDVTGFLDQSDMAAGAPISSQIREAIRSASAVLVLLSEDAVRSNWVPFEIGLAQSLGKPIIPVLLPTSELNKSILDLVKDYQVIDARNKPIPEIVKEIDSALELQEAR
ncbi:MAG TPA: toll/interleukin-1 receptor domain-containing protein [Blastocatellia bacterium]|nr:toll/interleukin-1 receptor domain-containing protein [Blastocatellia bacterium]